MGTVWDDQQRKRREAHDTEMSLRRLQQDSEQRRYLSTLSPADRSQYLASQRSVVTGSQMPAPPQADAPQDAPQAPGRPIAQGGHPMAGTPFEVSYATHGPQAQRNVLEGAIERTEDAIRDENDSRVAQAREAKRMEFARDMERMRQEALLKRLSMTQQDRPYTPPPSGHMRVWNPETLSWDYTDEVRLT